MFRLRSLLLRLMLLGLILTVSPEFAMAGDIPVGFNGYHQAKQWTRNGDNTADYYGWHGVKGWFEPPYGRVSYLSDFSSTWIGILCTDGSWAQIGYDKSYHSGTLHTYLFTEANYRTAFGLSDTGPLYWSGWGEQTNGRYAYSYYTGERLGAYYDIRLQINGQTDDSPHEDWPLGVDAGQAQAAGEVLYATERLGGHEHTENATQMGHSWMGNTPVGSGLYLADYSHQWTLWDDSLPYGLKSTWQDLRPYFYWSLGQNTFFWRNVVYGPGN